MLEEGRMSDFGNWMQTELADTGVSPNPHRYSVPHAMSDGQRNVSPGVGVSVEEKVSDLIQSLPHLEALLKSHSKNANDRIRDLAISSRERDQLLYQIIAARRQQVPAASTPAPSRPSPRGLQFQSRFNQPRRGKTAQGLPKGVPESSHNTLATGKFHKRLWG
jgi:hypothetical protein